MRKAKEARETLADAVEKKKPSTADDMQKTSKGLEMYLKLKDPGWRVELALISLLSGDGAESRVTRLLLEQLPANGKVVEIGDAVRGVQAMIEEPSFHGHCAFQSFGRLGHHWARDLAMMVVPGS